MALREPDTTNYRDVPMVVGPAAKEYAAQLKGA